MKKYFVNMGIAFVIICGVMATAIGAHGIASMIQTHRYTEIAEAYLQNGYAEYIRDEYDEIVIGETYEFSDGSALTSIWVYNDGEFVGGVSINMDYYGNKLM